MQSALIHVLAFMHKGVSHWACKGAEGFVTHSECASIHAFSTSVTQMLNLHPAFQWMRDS